MFAGESNLHKRRSYNFVDLMGDFGGVQRSSFALGVLIVGAWAKFRFELKAL